MPEALMTVLQYAQSRINHEADLDPEVLERAYDEVSALLDPPKTSVYISLLPDGTAVGWDTCGKCVKHLKVCTCKEPTRPAYIQKMIDRETPAKPIQSYIGKALTATPVEGTQNAEKPLHQKSSSDSTGEVIVQNGTLRCTSCSTNKSPDRGDVSDDGTFLCHTCQENT